MSESNAPSAPPLLGGRAALAIGASLVLLLGLLVGLLRADFSQRTTLESSTQNTAVGDDHFLDHRTRGPAPEVSFRGQKLIPPSPRHIEILDTKMQRAGELDGGGAALYTTKAEVPWEKGEAEQRGKPVYYLKVARDEYLRVQ